MLPNPKGVWSSEQKKAEYGAVLKEPKGKVASWYKSKATLFMKPADIDALTQEHIFNLGATKLKNSYLAFNRAIAKSDWEKAASECSRKGIQLTRNNYVKGLFQKAADAKKAAAPATGAPHAP